ncbi:unnamed protein product [Psylliodes chrysocephalus]|uniref:Uncharacterized protein n=1 Tax=Psylliodes chrysocephalus TaxID=3402493 RepID=A0A9P0GNU5_9CUCU|nr:unnamed protein product [Psylliodes chrysocephala]
MENRELADTAYKSRKNYKHNKIKKAKIAGKAHKNHKGRDVAPRKTGAYCRIYTPAEYENLIVEVNEKFEIQRPKTKDIIDIKKWWPKHYKKVVLSVDSYGKGVPRDQKTTFAISKWSHFTFSKSTPGLVTTRGSIDCFISNDFQLLQRMGTRPPLPTSDTPAYAGKVLINEKKMTNLNKLAKYIPAEYQDLYTEVFAWPTTRK